jgi:CRP-like cAMP-binding protein
MKTFSPGKVLFRQGDPDKVTYLLIDGLVKVTVQVENGVEGMLGVRIGGDVVGEMAVLNGRDRMATGTTCGDVVCAVIPGPAFLDFVSKNASMGLALSQMTGDRLYWADQIRTNLAAYEVDVCLSRVLLLLAAKHGWQTHDGIDIGIPLTQAEFGALIGAREVTVQRALRSLEADGLLRRGRRRVVILDRERLARFAEFADVNAAF